MMKQSAGFAVVLAVALTAVRFAAPSTGIAGHAQPESIAPDLKPGKKSSIAMPGKAPVHSGGCTAYNDAPDTGAFPRNDDKASATAVVNSFFSINTQKNSQPANRLASKTRIHYAVALAPDPRHTNLSLMFDRGWWPSSRRRRKKATPTTRTSSPGRQRRRRFHR